jgi:hypothetical protein
MKREAWDRYRFDALLFALGASETRPHYPAILSADHKGRAPNEEG